MKPNSQLVMETAVVLEPPPDFASWSKTFVKRYHLLSLLSIAAVLAFWHVISIHKILGGAFLPTPWAVVQEIYRLMGESLIGKNLFQHTWASLRRVFIGWSLACAVAIPLGVCMALNDYVRAVVKPVFDLFKPMPPISWISLSILWFGLGEESKVFIIIIGSFVPSLINSFNSLRLVDPALYDAARMLGANRRQEIMEVALYSILPATFAVEAQKGIVQHLAAADGNVYEDSAAGGSQSRNHVRFHHESPERKEGGRTTINHEDCFFLYEAIHQLIVAGAHDYAFLVQ